MRTYGIAGLILILFLGILVSVFAVQGWWALSISLLTVTIFVGALTSLLTARYLARLIRTDSRKLRSVSRNETRKLQEAVVASSEMSQKASKELLDTVIETSDSVRLIDEELRALQSQIKKDASRQKSHVTNSVIHAATEVEALLQIYSRFPDTKLPMPSAGGWAIDAQSLAYLISLVEDKKPRLILELGSGTSSIWMGYVARAIGAKLITLDHLEKYLEKTRAGVVRHGLESVVESRFAPLKPIEWEGVTYDWYSTDALEDLSDIDMVIVDGPPAATGPQARYPALPILESQLSETAVIVLDDAHRPDEVRILREWRQQFPSFEKLVFDTPRLAALERKVA